MARLGIIGGSGLYDLEGIELIEDIKLDTPFGDPSDSYKLCKLNDIEVAFLPRHGRAHSISPSKINYQANIYGMKELGVDRILSVSACGSLREEIKPLDFVIPSQFVDRTNQARNFTFFDEGIVAHVTFAHPVCAALAKILEKSVVKSGAQCHLDKTYLNMEGPQFSTLAESQLYRNWGMDIIGMTNLAEARLAREAEIAYVTLAAVTDYDCWHPDHDSVTIEQIIGNLNKNIAKAKAIIKDFIINSANQTNTADSALKYAIITPLDSVSAAAKDRLGLIIEKYLNKK